MCVVRCRPIIRHVVLASNVAVYTDGVLPPYVAIHISNASVEAYRVANVGVDVALNVFQHFVEISGACRTQEAGVAISLHEHTHTDVQRQT